MLPPSAWVAVDPYLFPARGRKHFYGNFLSIAELVELIPTFSPQGDGNDGDRVSVHLSKPLLIPTFSPQGDGNIGLSKLICTSLGRKLIPTFSPQGDGNKSGGAK